MTTLNTITPTRPLILIGCGKMGGAMLQGWLKKGLGENAVIIVDPYLEGAKKMAAGVPDSQFYEKLSDLPESISPSFVILAVKPQMMDDALSDLNRLDLRETVFVSIAAGKTIEYFQSHLGDEAAVVRSMPNTPAAIGYGMTAAFANAHVNDDEKSIVETLLNTVGLFEWVDAEKLLDAVTAVSGSGPAYVFHLVEAMAAAGAKVGLPEDLSLKLATQTIIGAGALLDQADEGATQLRINVTSPNGTTQAALDVLMGEEGIGRVVDKAVRAATERSKELAG